MADSPPGSLPPDPVADYRDNRLSHWERGNLDTLFALARTHAYVRATPHDYVAPASANCGDPPPSTKRQAARASALAAVGEYSRAAAALHSVPLAPAGPRLHDEHFRLHPWAQTPDPLPCALPDPFSLDRLTFPEASVDVCEVLSSSPYASAPFLDDYIRFEALRALRSRSHLRGIAKAIANAEVPVDVVHFLPSAALVPQDKLTPTECNALELSAKDMKGSVRPIGIGSVLVGYAMRVLLRAHGAEPASAMRSEADLQAIPPYSDFLLHSMREVQEALSHRIHTVRFAKLAARMPTSQAALTITASGAASYAL
eukprot:jgi/Tetstr1/426542/TSEL_016840.t1